MEEVVYLVPEVYPDYALKFYLSGTSGKRGPAEERIASVLECRLNSCHDMYIKDALRWTKMASQPWAAITKIMLDSGAFSAWSKGHPVKIEELLKAYGSVLDVADHSKVKIHLINLDVIPGSPGVTATPDEVAASIKESDINFKILTKTFGDIVLPVYHQGESEERLAEIMDMSSYICASPRNDLPEWTRVAWSEEVHKKIRPGIRTHGLATTGNIMTARVPWYSVDSAAWGWSGAMGKVNVLDDHGEWLAINISQESPDRHNAGQHYDNSPAPIKEIVEKRAAFHEIPVPLLRTCMTTRKLLNGLEIVEWLKTFKFKPVDYQPALFDL